MLRLNRRLRGRCTIGMLICFGWVISTMTILAIFSTALSGQRDYNWSPTEAEHHDVKVKDDILEIPFRRSLSADNPEVEHISEDNSHENYQKSKKIRTFYEEKKFNPFDSVLFPAKNPDSSNFDKSYNVLFKENVEKIVNTPLRDFIAKKNNYSKAASSKFRQRNAKIRPKVYQKLTREETAEGKIRSHIERITLNEGISGASSNKETQIPSTNLNSERRIEEKDSDTWTVAHIPATQIQMPVFAIDTKEIKVSACNDKGTPLVEDGIFWSKEAETLLPTGLTDDIVREFRRTVNSMAVRSMEPPQWNRCGRPKNQFIILEDGTPLCARYRYPQETLLRGEILSFYLSKLLAFDNVPSVVLVQLNSSDPLWHNQNITSAADWVPGAFVALIQWMEDLNHERSRVKMPRLLLSLYQSGITMTAENLDRGHLDADQLVSLLQWTDLILFDYISGHYDRVASMQDGAEREMRPSVMAESIRNLRQIHGNGKLVLIDNESGLIDGYELMYRGSQTGLQFLGFHRRLLHTICVFRRKTVSRIRWLAGMAHPDRILEEYTSIHEPLYRKLTETPEVELFRTYFRVRLKEVVLWLDHCNSIH